MPDIEEDVAPSREADRLEVRRPGLLGSLKESLLFILERPVLLVIAVALAIIVFLLDYLTGLEAPDPRDLAKSFAFPPLDAYSDLHLLSDRSSALVLPVSIAARIGAMTLFLCLLTRVRVNFPRLARATVVYLLAFVSFAIPFGLSALYVNLFGRLVSTGESSSLPLILLMVSPVVHGLLALLFTQLLLRAVLENEARITFKDPGLWLLAGLSTWIWFMIAGRAGTLFDQSPTLAFGVAFAAVVAQAVILGAAAIRIRR